MDITISSEAAMLSSLPSAGNVRLFINTDKGNVLYYVNSAGEFFIYSASDTQNMESCCSCEIAKQWMDRITCAMKSGVIDATEFGTFIANGLTVSAVESIDAETGVKTCTVNVGQQSATAVLSLTLAGLAERPLAIGENTQLVPTILPTNAPQGVIYFSSNTAKAVVTQTGVVYGIAAGSATVYAYSQANGNVFDTVIFTVS